MILEKEEQTALDTLVKPKSSISEQWLKETFLPSKALDKHSLNDLAKLFNFFDYNPQKCMDYVAKLRKNKPLAHKGIYRITSLLQKAGLTVSEISAKREANTENPTQKEISRIAKSIKAELSKFGSFSDDIQEEIKAIMSADELSDYDNDRKSFLRYLYLGRTIFLAKFLGKVTIPKQTIVWEVSELDGKIIKDNIYVNKSGKKLVEEVLTALEPDHKALAVVKEIDKYILELESSTGAELTREERTELYDEYRKSIEIQKINYEQEN